MWLFWLVIAYSIASIAWWTVRNGISPMPTSRKVLAVLQKNMPTLPVGSIIYELGAGWGTLALFLSRRYPHCRIMAFETSLIPYLCCLLRVKLAKNVCVTVVRKDFFRTSLRDASLVTCYLYPGAMTKLKDKFEQELKKETALVISHTFAVPGWKPYKTVYADDLYKTPIYFYLS